MYILYMYVCVYIYIYIYIYVYVYVYIYVCYIVIGKNIGTLLNMIKEGCENVSVLLILLIIYK